MTDLIERTICCCGAANSASKETVYKLLMPAYQGRMPACGHTCSRMSSDLYYYTAWLRASAIDMPSQLSSQPCCAPLVHCSQVDALGVQIPQAGWACS